MKKIYFILIICISLLYSFDNSIFGNTIDTLKYINSNNNNDIAKVDFLNKLSDEIIIDDPEKALEYSTKAFQISKKINYLKGTAYALYNSATSNYYIDEYEKAFENLRKSEPIFKKLQDFNGLGLVNNAYGEIYTLQGEYGHSIKSLYDGLANFEKTKNLAGIAKVNNNIGLIYKNQNEYEEALKFFIIAFENGNNISKGDASLNIGATNLLLQKYSEAQKYIKTAIEYGEINNDNYVLSAALDHLAVIEFHYDNLENAIDLLNQSIEMKIDLEDSQGIAVSYNNLGKVFLKQNLLDSAIICFEKSKNIAIEIGVKKELAEAYDGLANSYSKKNDYSKAFENLNNAFVYLKKFNQINSEILKEETSKKLTQKQAEIADAKKNSEILVLKKDQEIQAVKRNIMLSIALGLLVIVILIALFIFNRFRQKKKAHEQLMYHNQIIMQQKDEIRLRQKEITDSIHYAKKIQNAYLPSSEILSNAFSQNFILFKPKDIVSGDFYWFYEIEDKLVVAAADCTGHGVPGAFMSMLGIAFLKEIIVKEYITHSGIILNKLRKEIIKSLQQKGKEMESKDGMDIALCVIDKKTLLLEFSGANNPVYIIRNSVLHEIKADNMPVGIYEKMDKFSQNSFQLQANDNLYIGTDGYNDQFGGEKGKKFKSKQLKELLVSISVFDMQEQHIILEKTIETWKKQPEEEYEQTDDITIVGIRI